MNRNIRIARELVRIAKLMLNNKDMELERNLNEGQFYTYVHDDGEEEELNNLGLFNEFEHGAKSSEWKGKTTFEDWVNKMISEGRLKRKNG